MYLPKKKYFVKLFYSDKLHIISGSRARAMFLKGESPPGWFMRPEISKIVLTAVNSGKQVFEEIE